MSKRVINFYFDFMSPYAYLALHRLLGMAQLQDCKIDFHPIFLPTLKALVGNTSPPTRAMPIKIKYIRADLERWAQQYGIRVKTPSAHDSRRANCGTFFAINKGQAQDYVSLVMKRVWNDGIAVDSEELLHMAASDLGWDFNEFTRFLASSDPDALLNAANEGAARSGVFGSPTMAVDEQIWWGNDRLDFLETYLQETKHVTT